MALVIDDSAAERALDEALMDVYRAQRRAHMNACPVSLDTRRDRLDRAIAILLTHGDALCDAMAADFTTRPQLMSQFSDIAPAIKALRYARKHVARWMRPERRPLEFPLGLLGARGEVHYHPKGVVGLISPWNFPVNLTFGPLAGILAAGNRAMIKPSEMTPATSALMESLIGQYFDSKELCVVTGGVNVGRAFSAIPFDHLLFTGATSIGRHVMRAAAENLTPVTLELGGKSPVILSRTADMKQAAERIVIGKMMNAGQVCLAPDYCLVPEDQMQEMHDVLVAAAERLYPKVRDNIHYTAIVNRQHKNRLYDLIADARAEGARITDVNPAHETFSREDTNTTMPLYIMQETSDSMAVMQEEVFGPLLPLLPYGTIEDAIDYVNARERPLALYYFGKDRAEERLVLDKTLSGGVTVNDVVWHVGHESLPFGGIGASGMGVYHGREGFLSFSHARAVYRQTGFNLAKMIGLHPPYGKKLKRALRMQIGK